MLFSPFDDSDQSWISPRMSSHRPNDISRILDPSYSPSSSPTHSAMAYLDTHGDLHDPDYRDFPTLHPAKRVYPPRSATPCHSLAAAAYHATRPAWDHSDVADDALSDRDDAYLVDDDDDDDEWPADSRSRSSRRSSLTSGLHPRHHLYHQYHPRDYRHYTYPAHVHSSPEASPPTPRSSPLPDVSDHLYSEDREKLRKRPRSKTLRSTTSTTSTSEKTPRSLLFETDALHEADEPAEDDDDENIEQADDTRCEPEWTPTCTQAMRRQWQSISLSLRFGLFRAKRKVRTRFTGG